MPFSGNKTVPGRIPTRWSFGTVFELIEWEIDLEEWGCHLDFNDGVLTYQCGKGRAVYTGGYVPEFRIFAERVRGHNDPGYPISLFADELLGLSSHGMLGTFLPIILILLILNSLFDCITCSVCRFVQYGHRSWRAFLHGSWCRHRLPAAASARTSSF